MSNSELTGVKLSNNKKTTITLWLVVSVAALIGFIAFMVYYFFIAV